MEKVIFKVEATEKGVFTEVSGEYSKLVNSIANALISQPTYLAVLNDSISVAFKELSNRSKREQEQQKPKSKLIL